VFRDSSQVQKTRGLEKMFMGLRFLDGIALLVSTAMATKFAEEMSMSLRFLDKIVL